MALCTQANQQQVTRFDCPSEVRNGDRMATLPAQHVGQQKLLFVSRNGRPQLGCDLSEFRYGLDGHGFAVCSQSSHGSTLHPQCGATTVGPVMTRTVCSIGAIPVPVDRRVVPPVVPSGVAFKTGFHRRNGVTSATSMMYQIFFAASQRAPSALAVSLSVYGTFRSILMGELSAPCTGFTAFAIFGSPDDGNRRYGPASHHAFGSRRAWGRMIE